MLKNYDFLTARNGQLTIVYPITNKFGIEKFEELKVHGTENPTELAIRNVSLDDVDIAFQFKRQDGAARWVPINVVPAPGIGNTNRGFADRDQRLQ